MYRRARMGVGYLPQETSIFRGMTVEQNVIRRRRAARADNAASSGQVANCWPSCTSRICAPLPRCRCRAESVAGSKSPAPSQPSRFHVARRAFRRHRSIGDHRHPRRHPYLKGRGIGILITDHNVRETLEIIDRASIIHGGEVLFEGSAEEILADPEVRRVYLGDRFG